MKRIYNQVEEEKTVATITASYLSFLDSHGEELRRCRIDGTWLSRWPASSSPTCGYLGGYGGLDYEYRGAGNT